MYIHNLGQKFKQVAAEFPNSTAVITEAGSTTYKELDEHSDALAAYLGASGFKAGDLICLSGDKEILTIACILGALKAGVVYSVFDPDSPVERLSKIFGQCAPKMVLCGAQLKNAIKAAGFNSVDYQTAGKDATSIARHDLERAQIQLQQINANHPAYVMFTSGSTGVPKGATMTHQNVLNLISWSIDTYSYTNEDVLTNVNPLYFDNSVFDLYSSLFSGASIALFSAETVRNPGKLMQLLDEYKCTSWFSVPSMLIFLQTVRAVSRTNMTYLRRIIFGGEGYPKAKLKQLFDMYSSRITFYNVYGPTECTCICSSYEVSPDDFEDVKGFLPLGSMIPNFDYLIVDDELMPVAPGQNGELVLLGPNGGLGYYRDPERTKVGFIQNPAHDAFKDTAYRTGDVVNINPADGKVYILGRQDNQIKHMGYRIELEEIENALSCIDSVKQSAVVHCEIRSLSQIVAFIKTESIGIEEGQLRTKLQEIIPHYMIPTRFEFVDQLPKNANGKLDRKKLKSDYMVAHANG